MDENKKEKIINETRNIFVECLKGLVEEETNTDDFEKFEEEEEKK